MSTLHCAGEILKVSFISMVRSTIHNNPANWIVLRKWSLLKTLFKPEELKNAGLKWKCERKNFELFENDAFTGDVHVIKPNHKGWTQALLRSVIIAIKTSNKKMVFKCLRRSGDGKQLKRFQSDYVVFKFIGRSWGGAWNLWWNSLWCSLLITKIGWKRHAGLIYWKFEHCTILWTFEFTLRYIFLSHMKCCGGEEKIIALKWTTLCPNTHAIYWQRALNKLGLVLSLSISGLLNGSHKFTFLTGLVHTASGKYKNGPSIPKVGPHYAQRAGEKLALRLFQLNHG